MMMTTKIKKSLKNKKNMIKINIMMKMMMTMTMMKKMSSENKKNKIFYNFMHLYYN